jgi:ribose transport system substrate-binding protein
MTPAKYNCDPLKFATHTPRVVWNLCRKGLLWQAVYLVSCAAVPAKTSHFVIVAPSGYPTMADALDEGCKKAERELPGAIACDVIAQDGGVIVQNQVIGDAVAKGVDGIAIYPAEPTGLARSLKIAKDAGIPVVTFGSDLSPVDRKARSAFIGVDNRQVGDELAKLLLLIKPKGGKYCVQAGVTAPANQERLEAIQNTLTTAHGWEEIAGCPLVVSVGSEQGLEQLRATLGKNPELDGFISTDGAPQFAPDAYDTFSPLGKQISTGAFAFLAGGILPEQTALLKKGLSSGQVGTNYSELGYRVALLLNEIKQGNNPSDSTLIRPVVAVYKDAVQDQNKCPPPDGTHNCGDGTCASTCSAK